MKKIHFMVVAIGMFVLGFIGAIYFYETSIAIAITSLLCGFVLSILFVIPILGELSRGRVEVNDKGVSLEWNVRQKDPLDTISSPNPTNSSESEKAKELCQKGRDILDVKSDDENVDLDQAFKYFDEATKIDDGYWEPRLNMAVILIIKGQLEDAYNLASRVRNSAGSNSLAYANSSLIMASAIETSIDPESTTKIQNKKYSVIVKILDESLVRDEKDVVVRVAKIKSKILGNYTKKEIEDEIKEGIKHAGFREEFAYVMNNDDSLKKAFISEYPTLSISIFPTRKDEVTI